MTSPPVSGSLRIRWMMALELGLSRSRLRSRKVTCAVEAESVRSRSNSTSTSSVAARRPARLVRRAALDAALGVRDHRLRRPVALGDRDRQRLVGELGGEAGVAHHLGPGADVAALDGGVAVLDRLRRSRPARRCARPRRSPSGSRRARRRAPRRRRPPACTGIWQRDAGPELGRRGDAAELEDLRPEVGVLEVALGDAADGVAGARRRRSRAAPPPARPAPAPRAQGRRAAARPPLASRACVSPPCRIRPPRRKYMNL